MSRKEGGRFVKTAAGDGDKGWPPENPFRLSTCRVRIRRARTRLVRTRRARTRRVRTRRAGIRSARRLPGKSRSYPRLIFLERRIRLNKAMYPTRLVEESPMRRKMLGALCLLVIGSAGIRQHVRAVGAASHGNLFLLFGLVLDPFVVFMTTCFR